MSIRFFLFLAAILSLMAGSVSAELSAKHVQILATKCVQCHAAPHTGAPQFGNREQWHHVLQQGEEQTLINVVHGIRGMPPLGYCSACSEEDLRELIRFAAGFPTATGEAK